jgi:hypothetical protein
MPDFGKFNQYFYALKKNENYLKMLNYLIRLKVNVFRFSILLSIFFVKMVQMCHGKLDFAMANCYYTMATFS